MAKIKRFVMIALVKNHGFHFGQIQRRELDKKAGLILPARIEAQMAVGVAGKGCSYILGMEGYFK
ncbi:hypothetical protein IM774_11115 [Erysipelotrichaceae bacterium RD49]|nr:hypothetical protein [Erysipelotrichaceae bacterium RD49]